MVPVSGFEVHAAFAVDGQFTSCRCEYRRRSGDYYAATPVVADFTPLTAVSATDTLGVSIAGMSAAVTAETLQ